MPLLVGLYSYTHIGLAHAGEAEQPHARLAFGLAPRLLEHLDPGLVGVDYVAGQQQLLHPRPQPGQPQLPDPHRPVGHVLPGYRRAQALEVVFHSVEGQRVDVFAAEHVGYQRRRGERALDGRGRHRRAHDGSGGVLAGGVGRAAIGATVDGALVALGHQMRRHHAKRVGDLDLEFFQAGAAFGAFPGRFGQLVANHHLLEP